MNINNIKIKNKTKQRFWHTLARAFQRYNSILSVDDIMFKIPSLINAGFYKDANYTQVPKSTRQVGCGYYVVDFENKEYIIVLDQFANEIKTFLPNEKEGVMGSLGDFHFHNEDTDLEWEKIKFDLKYKVSQMFSQMNIELGREPTISELSQESGISETILKNL